MRVTAPPASQDASSISPQDALDDHRGAVNRLNDALCAQGIDLNEDMFDVCARAGAVNEESVDLVELKASMDDQGVALDAQIDALNDQTRQPRVKGPAPARLAALARKRRAFFVHGVRPVRATPVSGPWVEGHEDTVPARRRNP
jgi:hypothetical protein